MGNPNWQKNGPSPNPGGRPKLEPAFRTQARKAVDEKVVARWEKELDENGPDWLRCSELLVAYGYGKPSAVETTFQEPLENRFNLDLLSVDELLELAGPGASGEQVSMERMQELMLKATPPDLIDLVSLALQRLIAGIRSKESLR